MRNPSAGKIHFTRCREIKTGRQPEQSRFTAARGPDDGQKFPLVKRDGNVLQRAKLAALLIAKSLRDIFKFKKRDAVQSHRKSLVLEKRNAKSVRAPSRPTKRMAAKTRSVSR